MNEFMEIAFSKVNMPLSVLLIILVLYWIFSIVSGADTDLDIDVDTDMDLDIESDFHNNDVSISDTISLDDTTNAEIEERRLRKRGKLNWVQLFLVYFNFVGLPFIFTLTFFATLWWLLTISITSIFHIYDSHFGFIVFFGAILPALILAKFLTNPFKSFFKKLNVKGDSPIELIGREGKLLSTIENDKKGRIEVVINKDVFNVYAKSIKGERIDYNSKIIIIKKLDEDNLFAIKKLNN